MTSLLLLTLATIPAAAPPSAPAKLVTLSSRALYDRAVRGTAYVEAGDGAGTGWILDVKRKLLVTNFHVASAGECRVYFPIFHNGKIVSDPKRYANKFVRGKVIDSDPKIDLAVIEVDSVPEGMHALRLSAEPASPGDRLHLVGNPGVSKGLFVYTTGTLRSTTEHKITFARNAQSVDVRTLETQMATNGGDSGSAVLDDYGQVVGVNFAGYSGGKVDQNGEFTVVNTFALAIALEELRVFVDDTYDLRDDRARAGTYERRAGRLARKGDVESAVADLKRAIEMDPKRAAAYVQLATLNYHRGNLDAVILDTTAALDLDPRHAEAANLRGCAYAVRGDRKSALADLLLAIRLAPKNATYRTNRGMVHVEMKNDEGAVTDFTAAIELSPRSALAYLERGKIYHRQREFQKAINDFAVGVWLAPRSPEMLTWLADARLQNREHDKAAAVYVQALKLNGRDAQTWRGLGDARLALGQFDQAVEAYGKAIEFGPTDALARYRRGEALEARGDVDEAQSDYSKAIELNPELARELKVFQGRQVKVTNNTAEPLKVYVSYEAISESWPGDRVPQSGWLSFTVAPGATQTLEHDGKPIEAKKVRLWAEGSKTGKKHDVLKKRDLVLVERTYRARQIDAHVHRFGD